jgi:hypothetical protein
LVGIVGQTDLSLVTNVHVCIGYSRQSRQHYNTIGILGPSVTEYSRLTKKLLILPVKLKHVNTHKHNITVALTQKHTHTHKDAQTHTLSLSLSISLSLSLSLSLIVMPNSSKGNCLCELQVKIVSENPSQVFFRVLCVSSIQQKLILFPE